MVKGKASYDHFSGGVRLSADELFDIETARSQLARHMRIQLSHDQLSANHIQQLRAILEPNDEGQCGVGFEYRGANGYCQIEVDHNWRVVPNKVMLDKLDQLVGLPRIRLIY